MIVCFAVMSGGCYGCRQGGKDAEGLNSHCVRLAKEKRNASASEDL